MWLIQPNNNQKVLWRRIRRRRDTATLEVFEDLAKHRHGDTTVAIDLREKPQQ